MIHYLYFVIIIFWPGELIFQAWNDILVRRCLSYHSFRKVFQRLIATRMVATQTTLLTTILIDIRIVLLTLGATVGRIFTGGNAVDLFFGAPLHSRSVRTAPLKNTSA